MQREKNKILSGALVLGVGAFVAKLLGALYRVPLTNLLGGLGLGLYQMVFPVYTVLLDFSGAGVPSALSRIISSGEEDKISASKYLKASLKLLIWFGLAFSLLMLFLAKPLANIQGDKRAFLGYIFLSPSVMFVSLISCFRGYFQGLMNMTPTAISQIIEQTVKLCLGLLFVYLLSSSVSWAVAGATLAITLSELLALIYLFVLYKRCNRGISLPKLSKVDFKTMAKSIIKITLPVTLVGIMLPLSQVLDSFLALNIIRSYRADATSLYGLLSGVVATVIGLPVAVCYGLATVAIPAVAKGKTKQEQNKSGVKTLFLTLAVSIPCAIACYAFAPFIINLLFARLESGERVIATNLLRLSSPCIALLSFLQTANAVLIGKGKPYLPVLSLGLGVIIKEILNIILLKMPNINIYGGAIAIIACYFSVCLINLIMIFGFKVKNENECAYRRQYTG